jgi:hypothetical protein
MKRKVLIIRFGTNQVIRPDAIACSKIHSEDMGTALGVPFGNMGVISLFYTNKSIEEIVKIYKEIGVDRGVDMPIITYELDSPAAGQLLSAVDNFDILLEKAREIWPDRERVNCYANLNSECTLSLDQLLDRVGQVGLENMGEAERKRLEELSKL